MKIIFKENNRYLIRFDQGEEVIEGLQNFCKTKKIEGGWFSAIGTTAEVVLSFYEIRKKEYLDKIIKEDLEIAALSGNIAKINGRVIIHCHGVFSDQNMKAFAGHVKKLMVLATCEIILEKLGGRLERRHNEKTGLNLMQ